MTTPSVSIIIARETTIDVVYDQAITSSTNRPGEGFTFKVNGAQKFANSADLTAADTITFQMAGVISNEDTVLVSYDDDVSNIENLSDELAPSFTDVGATNQSQHAALLAAVCALSIIEPNVITLVTSMPLSSTDFEAGLSVKANGFSVPFDTVELGQDPRQLRITFPGGFSYGDTITFTYNPSIGDWQSAGYDIVAFTDYPVTNGSRLGTPNDNYPLSSVVREELEAINGAIDATIGIDLNHIDQKLVERYGPAVVDFGGTFGQTNDNPAGVFLAQDMRPIKSGMKVTKRFTSQGHSDWAQVAAAEWQDAVTQRIGTALGIMRTTDQQVVLGDRTVRQV
jgi:hypothetical protein